MQLLSTIQLATDSISVTEGDPRHEARTHLQTRSADAPTDPPHVLGQLRALEPPDGTYKTHEIIRPRTRGVIKPRGSTYRPQARVDLQRNAGRPTDRGSTSQTPNALDLSAPRLTIRGHVQRARLAVPALADHRGGRPVPGGRRCSRSSVKRALTTDDRVGGSVDVVRSDPG